MLKEGKGKELWKTKEMEGKENGVKRMETKEKLRINRRRVEMGWL